MTGKASGGHLLCLCAGFLAMGVMQNLMDNFSVLFAESCKCSKASNKTKAREHQFEG